MAFAYGMFTGGWGMHYGIERIGATVIPAGTGNTERHLMMMQDFGTTVLVSTPSYALYLAEVGRGGWASTSGPPPAAGALRRRACPSEAEGARSRSGSASRATDNYGLSEVMGPGVRGRVRVRAAGCTSPRTISCAEVVDPGTGEPVAEGEEGELVLTTLTKEAFPVLRYRTHDLTTLDYERCECGRTMARMRKVRKRTDDMLIIRGVNVFPSQIEDVLFKIEGVRPHYLIVVDRKQGLDDLEVRLEVDEAVLLRFDGRHGRVPARRGRPAPGRRSACRTKVKLVEHGTIERTAGKSRRVLDLRDKE